MQAQAQQHSVTSSNVSAANAYYLQRHQNEQQQPPDSSMLSLRPDLAKASAANNMKGSGYSSQFGVVQSSGKSHQLVPAAVQVKPAEQKQQPAGE